MARTRLTTSNKLPKTIHMARPAPKAAVPCHWPYNKGMAAPSTILNTITRASWRTISIMLARFQFAMTPNTIRTRAGIIKGTNTLLK